MSRALVLMVASLLLLGCAPTIWERVDTTEAQIKIDRAQCELMAQSATPASVSTMSERPRREIEEDYEPINTGNRGYDAYSNAAHEVGRMGRERGEAIGSGIAAMGAAIERVGARRQTFNLCMQAKGYVERPDASP